MTKFASFLRPYLASRQKQTGDHPDANLLLAFAEGGLSGREHKLMLAHLAECPDCREVLSLSSATSGYQPASQGAFPKAVSTWWGWRLAATVAVLCFVTATVWRMPFFKGRPETTSPLKPSVTGRPLSSVPAPPVPQAVEPDKANPRPRLPGRRSALPSAVHEPSRDSFAVSPAKPPNDAEKSLGSFDFATSEQAKAQAPALTALRPQYSIADPNTSQNLVMPSQRPSAIAGAVPAYKLLRVAPGNEKTLWSLETSSGSGTVNKSEDGGRTWRTIPIEKSTQLYALSASGSDTWVGGGGGKLFHSIDEGLHWMPVTVADENTSLGEAIVGIDARGPAITLKTNSGATWATGDGGLHWRRE